MIVTIRPTGKREIAALAELIEEVGRFHGSTDGRPADADGPKRTSVLVPVGGITSSRLRKGVRESRRAARLRR
ncbi:hypothetical protein ACH5AO_03520 [Streptomyces sp. NPDC018964]|uniref:hypothetical protein n=1 Tax=Streptomyces sp. NPDC018964 TaxID=3365058 RepID=UPI003798C0FF